MQVEGFLARYPPFDSLDAEALDGIARATQIEFFPAGATIIRRGGPPARFLYVVRTGGVELLDDRTVIDLLEEGEVFGHPSLVSGVAPSFSVRAFEDTLCYLIEGEVADRVIRTPSGMTFLARELVRRNRQASLASEVTGIVQPPVSVSSPGRTGGSGWRER